ncbi:MAG: FAD-binding oxidoreductase [Gemmatales bacterium]|nr:FAD-binding oxidoreductase [Gemmatales bacterium]MDW8222555.1 FAD-binding oxidoreductase [Gemmatales bacterium]
MARNYDAVVVGGGIMGLSIAWSLARRAAGRIALLEKAYLGAGGSGKSGAIIRQHYSNRLTAQLARDSLRIFQEFDQVVQGPPVFTRTGLAIVVHQNDLPALQANLQMQQELGIDVHLVSARELAELDPNTRLAEDEVAAWESEAGYVDAIQALTSYAQACQREGVEIQEGVEVRQLLRQGNRAVGLETNEGRLNCGIVALAVGPWINRLADSLRVDIPVQASRTQVALFRRPVEMGRRTATCVDFVGQIYYRATAGELLHVGSIAGEEVRDRVDPDDYSEVADRDWVPAIRQRLQQRCPAMHRCYGRGGYAALYDITPDWHPILDRCPQMENVYLAVGFSGHGFKFAPMIGQLLAELIVDGQYRSLDVTAFRLNRFAEGQLIKTRYTYGVIA